MVYTWPSGANHTSDKDALPDKLKNAIMSVARITLNTPGKRMTTTEFTMAVRNQFSGNRLRVRFNMYTMECSCSAMPHPCNAYILLNSTSGK